MNKKIKSLVYFGVFLNKDYMNLLRLLFESMAISSTDMGKFDIMVFTSNDFTDDISKISKQYNVNIIVKTVDFLYTKYKVGRRPTQKRYIDILDASQMSLRIFELVDTNSYDKFLYLDSDILILNDLNEIFNMRLENKLYAEQEDTIASEHHGAQFFDFTKINKNTPAFCAGVLLFKNCNEIKCLFEKTLNHILEYVKSGQRIPRCVEQPFLVYNTLDSGMYNSQLTKIINGEEQILKHFIGACGSGETKYKIMSDYLSNITIKKENVRK